MLAYESLEISSSTAIPKARTEEHRGSESESITTVA
jgi:hypothetical protein